jgi:hypothetical protein
MRNKQRKAQLTSIIRSYSFVVIRAEGVQDGGDVDVTQRIPTCGPKKKNKLSNRRINLA